MIVIKEDGFAPIKAWVGNRPWKDATGEDYLMNGAVEPDIEETAMKQVRNLAKMPFLASNGVALMPDVHAGIGATVGSVIATRKAIIPAAVGVDIGCGMNAVRLSLRASQLPDNLKPLRDAIEAKVPLGPGGAHKDLRTWSLEWVKTVPSEVLPSTEKDYWKLLDKAGRQLGTLGSGNHFIEVCVEVDSKESDPQVWIMLHSGSRGIGNLIGKDNIDKAKRLMEQYFIPLPDKDLAFFAEDTEPFKQYMQAVEWAQTYALENRRLMMDAVLDAMQENISTPFFVDSEAVNCHHNYVSRENHFGENLWVTRKGAISAREGELGIIPGSMGQRSYIVKGKGNRESYCSCSHGAGRRFSRGEARRRFKVSDLVSLTEGVECRKDESVLDEIPSAYKDIDAVMALQTDLVEVVHTLKQVLCVKGS